MNEKSCIIDGSPERLPEDSPPVAAPALMTAAELATELQVSERTVRRLEVTGKVGPKPINVGRSVRYLRDEAQRWIEAGCPDRENWGGRRLERKH